MSVNHLKQLSAKSLQHLFNYKSPPKWTTNDPQRWFQSCLWDHQCCSSHFCWTLCPDLCRSHPAIVQVSPFNSHEFTTNPTAFHGFGSTLHHILTQFHIAFTNPSIYPLLYCPLSLSNLSLICKWSNGSASIFFNSFLVISFRLRWFFFRVSRCHGAP